MMNGDFNLFVHGELTSIFLKRKWMKLQNKIVEKDICLYEWKEIKKFYAHGNRKRHGYFVTRPELKYAQGTVLVKHALRKTLNLSTVLVCSMFGGSWLQSTFHWMFNLGFIWYMYWRLNLQYYGEWSLVSYSHICLYDNKIIELYLSCQTNSFIAFTCPNLVLLVPGFGQVC